MPPREFLPPYNSAFGAYSVAVFCLQDFCMALSSTVSQLVSVIPFAELLCLTAVSAQLMGLQAMAEGGKSGRQISSDESRSADPLSKQSEPNRFCFLSLFLG